MFVNRDAISKIPFLKNRDNKFYLDFLGKLSPMRFDQGDIIYSVGHVPREVYFILDGKVLNTTTTRVYKTGFMFGHEDILFDRKRDSQLKAETEVFTLRLERDNFERMLDDFPAIKYEMVKQGDERELFMKFYRVIRSPGYLENCSKTIDKVLLDIVDKEQYERVHQSNEALVYKDNALNRSTEFVLKNKRLVGKIHFDLDI